MTSPAAKVYEIYQDFTTQKDWPERHAVFKALREDVLTLAASRRETIYFHQHLASVDGSPPMGGALCLRIECSEAFIDEVKKFKNFGTVNEQYDGPHHKTFRSGIAGPVDGASMKAVFVKSYPPGVSPAHGLSNLVQKMQELAFKNNETGKLLVYDTSEDLSRIRLFCPDSLDDQVSKLGHCRLFKYPPRRKPGAGPVA